MTSRVAREAVRLRKNFARPLHITQWASINTVVCFKTSPVHLFLDLTEVDKECVNSVAQALQI